MRKGLLIATIGILACLASCKQMISTNNSGFILGASNDMDELKVESASKDVRDLFKSTVLISTELIHQNKRKFCSGTIIEPEKGDDPDELRILTNFHCFAQTTEDGEVNREFLPEACDNTKVYFGFAKEKAEDVEQADCEGGTLIGDFTGDLAVFKLNKEAPKGFKPLKLWTDPNVPSGRKALIIHHPDIRERFTSIGDTSETLPAASITEDNCETTGDFATDEWTLDHTLPYSTKHTCDLVHGSSGSALLDAETKMILGVNWGGIEIKYKDKKKKFNAATKGFYVEAFLDGELAPIKEKSDKIAQDAALKREQKQRTDGGQVGGEINEALCGTLGDSANKTNAPWAFFLLLALPLLPVLRRRLAA